jgi:hypothetical protein
MSRELTSLKRVGLLVLLTAVLTIAGCSDNSVLGPDQNDPVTLSRVAPGITLPDADLTVAETAVAVSAQDGGVVSINTASYDHSFIVKPGSINSDKVISVTVKKEKVGKEDVVSFEFGPDGLVFSEASKLEFQMAELNAGARSGRLYYFDPKVKDWVLQAEQAVVNGVVTFDIYHFSKYAISD